jgi:hypothetical protein
MMRVRQINVMRATVTNALDPYYMPVTLPAAPWEDGEDFAKINRERQREKDKNRLVIEAMREAAKTQKKPGERSRCRVPGCGKVLYDGNKSGVCHSHAHSAWCACTVCSARRGQ